MLAQTAPEVVVVFVLIIGRARPLFVKFATLSTLQYKVCYGKIRNAQIEKSTIFNTDSNSTGYEPNYVTIEWWYNKSESGMVALLYRQISKSAVVREDIHKD